VTQGVSCATLSHTMRLVDLYCGVVSELVLASCSKESLIALLLIPLVPRPSQGGMSSGAIEAGAYVVLGCDSSATPLKVWSSNVGPGGKAVLANLGTDEVTLP